jgi:hypothetical protein
MVWISFAVMLLIWILEHWPHMQPKVELGAPPIEVLAAAKAVAAAAEKWGHTADMLNAWGPWVLGLVVVLLVSGILAVWKKNA